MPIRSRLVDLVATQDEQAAGPTTCSPSIPSPSGSTYSGAERSTCIQRVHRISPLSGPSESGSGPQALASSPASIRSRRYFITKAEQADQMEHIIAVVVGHKRTGMTLGRYSGGPLLEQARRCVEAVKLP